MVMLKKQYIGKYEISVYIWFIFDLVNILLMIVYFVSVTYLVVLFC